MKDRSMTFHYDNDVEDKIQQYMKNRRIESKQFAVTRMMLTGFQADQLITATEQEILTEKVPTNHLYDPKRPETWNWQTDIDKLPPEGRALLSYKLKSMVGEKEVARLRTLHKSAAFDE